MLTAVMMPEGHSADAFRATALKHYDISLGNGLSKVADKVFRIGHLGDFNDLTLAGVLTGVGPAAQGRGSTSGWRDRRGAEGPRRDPQPGVAA